MKKILITLSLLSFGCLINGAAEKKELAAEDQAKLNEKFLEAVRKRQKEELILLLKQGADINAQDKNGMTALIWAAQQLGNKEIVELLLNHCADINIRDDFDTTALIMAAEWNRKETIELLLDRGADINIKQIDGKTALDLAENEEVLSLFKKYAEYQECLKNKSVLKAQAIDEALNIEEMPVDVLKIVASYDDEAFSDSLKNQEQSSSSCSASTTS